MPAVLEVLRPLGVSIRRAVNSGVPARTVTSSASAADEPGIENSSSPVRPSDSPTRRRELQRQDAHPRTRFERWMRSKDSAMTARDAEQAWCLGRPVT
jgi:hypothetical protein